MERQKEASASAVVNASTSAKHPVVLYVLQDDDMHPVMVAGSSRPDEHRYRTAITVALSLTVVMMMIPNNANVGTPVLEQMAVLRAGNMNCKNTF